MAQSHQGGFSEFDRTSRDLLVSRGDAEDVTEAIFRSAGLEQFLSKELKAPNYVFNVFRYDHSGTQGEKSVHYYEIIIHDRSKLASVGEGDVEVGTITIRETQVSPKDKPDLDPTFEWEFTSTQNLKP